MIKVLHVLTDTNIGGAGRYLFNLLSRVDYSCFEVVVACPGGGELEKQLKSKGIRVFTLEGGESSANFGHIKTKANYFPEKAILHTHASLPGA